MLTLRQLSIVLIFSEIFFRRFVHLELDVDFYKKHHLIQAGERTFACSGRPMELRWKYRYPDHIKTVWSKQKGKNLVNIASWSGNTFTLEPQAASVGFTADRLTSKDCCGLILTKVVKEDDGLYAIVVTTDDSYAKVKTGNTTLYVYDDCPDVSAPQLKMACDVEGGSVKTNDFTYRDIVDLSVAIPNDAVVQRRFFYQEQQHKIVQQPIRARCYNRDDCDVVHWTMSKKSLSLAFFAKIPFLNMTLHARLYHKKAILAVLNTTFRIVDPESEIGKSVPKCKAREVLPPTPTGGISIQWKPSTWNVILSTSLTFAVSNFIHPII